jgi:hypothetical protein
MADFVGQGYLIFDEMVPRHLCDALLPGIESLQGYQDVGSPFRNMWKDHKVGDIFRLPRVEGMIHSLVGPDPLYDHHAVHIVPPRTEMGANLHQDSVTDLRENYFDIQISLFPQDTPPEIGGTTFIPGTHFRNIRTGEGSYYQHIRGRKYANCKAGTVIVWDTRLWHAARSNRTDKTRYMFKLRLNPSVPQIRLFDTTDLDHPDIVRNLSKIQPFFGNDARYELMQRVLRWRYISDQPTFDLSERFLRRIEYNPSKTPNFETPM